MNSQDPKICAAAAYNAAADRYDDPRLSFWERFGRRTIERLGLERGARVLDVCCGSGASALVAAERVGPEGRVLGVDLAENLVRRARVKAMIRRLGNVEFQVDDFERLDVPAASFDAVVCVFGIYLMSDMWGALRRLWRWLKPGGRLAVTTWGPRLFEPASSLFWQAVCAERPELYKGFNPWDRIAQPAALERLLEEAGIPAPRTEAEAGVHPLAQPEDWWTIVQGSGYRATLEELDVQARARVRERTLRALVASGATNVETNVIYATAVKAGCPAARFSPVLAGALP
jgi:ubiquinone/menaquinone biosynthesis C-methylase UbiE